MNDTIKKSGICEFLQNEHHLKVGNDVDAAANEALNELLVKAAERARADERHTVKARDV